MTIAFVQQAGAGSAVDGVASFASASTSYTAGNLLVAVVAWSFSGAGSPTINVPAGWTAPLASLVNGAPNGVARAYYMANNPGGLQAWTWTLTPAGVTTMGSAWTIFEFSGVVTSSPLDLTAVQHATGGSSSTSVDSTAATGTTASADLLIELCGMARSTAGTLTTDTTNSVPTSGWSVGTRFDSTNSTVNAHTSGQYNILAGTQASPRGVLTSSLAISNEAFLLTFKSAATPVGGVPPRTRAAMQAVKRAVGW